MIDLTKAIEAAHAINYGVTILHTERIVLAALPEIRAEIAKEIRRFRFTDDQWSAYQDMPDQGYSHRTVLEDLFNDWLDEESARIAEGKTE